MTQFTIMSKDPVPKRLPSQHSDANMNWTVSAKESIFCSAGLWTFLIIDIYPEKFHITYP